MSGFIADGFSLRDNALTRIDARIKLILAMELLCAVVLSRQAVLPLAALAICILLALAVRTPVKTALLRVAAPVGMVGVLVVLQAFLSGSIPLWTWEAWSWKITVTRDGLQAGLLSGARVFGAVSVVSLLSLVTPMPHLFQALHWLRVPQGWLEVAVLMYRYLFTLRELALDVTAAQRLRLGYCGRRRGMQSMSVMMGTVIIRSIDQAVRTHEAMVLRGYRGTIPLGAMDPLSVSSWAALALGSLLAWAAFFLLEGHVL